MKKSSAVLFAAALLLTIVFGASIPAIQKGSARLAVQIVSAEETSSSVPEGRDGSSRMGNLSASLSIGGCFVAVFTLTALLGTAVYAAAESEEIRGRNCRVVDLEEIRRRAAVSRRRITRGGAAS